MKDVTGEVYERIFPDRSRLQPKPQGSYKRNDIIPRNIAIIGGQGSGKTTAVRDIAEEAVRKYGLENVNAAYAKGDPSPLFDAIDGKLVQLLVCDDFTVTEQSKQDLSKLLQVRQMMMDRFGRANGLVITILTVPTLYGIDDPELRSNFDVFLFRSPPHDFDRDITERSVGEDGVSWLNKLADLQLEDERHKAWGVCTTGSSTGFFCSLPANHDFLRSARVHSNANSPVRLTYTVPLMMVGFLLTFAGTSHSAFQGALFGSGILLWIIGGLGTAYCIVNRLSGPKAAKLVVAFLIFTLLAEIIFGPRRDKRKRSY